MKKLAIIIASLAALSGCATYYPAPGYASRAYGQPDANGWQVVSVTPVASGVTSSVTAVSPAASSGGSGRGAMTAPRFCETSHAQRG